MNLTANSPIHEILLTYESFLKDDRQEKSNNKRLAVIKQFCTFYAQVLEKEPSLLTLSDLETIPHSVIQFFFTTSSVRLTGQKSILSSLSSFWTYLSCYSFTIERGRPLFYRHAFNEWKIAYKKTYLTIKNATSRRESNSTFFNENELLALLEYCDNSYATELPTEQKAKNWEKNKERNLAIIGLIAGAGLSLEELSTLTMHDIDMRKKTVIVNRNNEKCEIPILSFACPYISPYIKTRRQWWMREIGQSLVFLNQQKKGLAATSIGTMLNKVSELYTKEVSALILKQSHTALVYDQTKDLTLAKTLSGYSSLTPLEKIL